MESKAIPKTKFKDDWLDPHIKLWIDVALKSGAELQF
jgi:hypothetical protein